MDQQRDEEDRKQGEQEAVPGVRAPLGPAGTAPDPKGEDTPGLEEDVQPPNWGGEGGAGTYPGGPTVSDDKGTSPVTEPRTPGVD